MTWSSARSWCSFVAVLVGAPLVFACGVGASGAPTKKKAPTDDFFGEEEVPTAEEPMEPEHVNENSSAFGASERPAGPPPDQDDAGAPSDAGPGPKVYCGAVLAPGDLAVVELMIASRSGSGDSGEWVEIRSTRDCWLKLQGVAVESPRGTSAPNVATILDDFELEPHGTFVVADSADPLKNHGISGRVIAWEATDVLKNDGDTVTVKLGPILIDAVTYPAFTNLTAGRALAFPFDCAWTERANWARWSLTFTEFAPGFKGTPNAPNADIACF